MMILILVTALLYSAHVVSSQDGSSSVLIPSMASDAASTDALQGMSTSMADDSISVTSGDLSASETAFPSLLSSPDMTSSSSPDMTSSSSPDMTSSSSSDMLPSSSPDMTSSSSSDMSPSLSPDMSPSSSTSSSSPDMSPSLSPDMSPSSSPDMTPSSSPDMTSSSSSDMSPSLSPDMTSSSSSDMSPSLSPDMTSSSSSDMSPSLSPDMTSSSSSDMSSSPPPEVAMSPTPSASSDADTAGVVPSTSTSDAAASTSSETPTSTSTPIPPGNSGAQSGLTKAEMQLAVALPVSVLGYLIILIVLAVLVLAVRRRKKWHDDKQQDRRQKYSSLYIGVEDATMFSNDEVEDQEEVVSVKPRPMRVSYMHKVPVMSHSLTLVELGSLLEQPKEISNEFENIPTNLVSMDDVPPGAENKNRYKNILPNPHTRVPLFLKFGVANSDYINANYIRGSIGTPRSYISTQGPLWNTTPDFWRMIWEQRSSVIVMVTELTENSMTKCHQYWPDEQEGRTSVYDDIEVTLAKKVVDQTTVTTTFLLRHLEKGVTREVIHFWFRAWPDHDVPNSSEPFLNFVQSVRSASSDMPGGPVTVHCSAGIGRSGVFLATLLGMECLEESGELDILKAVSSMRQDRGGMVQNKNQYIFIHTCLYQYGLWLAKTANTKTFQLSETLDSGSQIKLLED